MIGVLVVSPFTPKLVVFLKGLFEEKVKGRWKGRTQNTKLVFVESEQNLRGKTLPVQITWAGPWSMQARLLPKHADQPIVLDTITS